MNCQMTSSKCKTGTDRMYDFSKKIFSEMTKTLIECLLERNKKLPPTEILKIKTMAGCS